MFYSADILRTSSPGDRSARLLWGTSPKRQGRSQDTKRISQGIKRLLLIKENQTYQVKEFSTFLCMRRCKVWAYWNYPFDRHLSYLGPVSCVFSFWVPSGLTTGMAITRWLNGCSTLFFFSFTDGTQYFSFTNTSCGDSVEFGFPFQKADTETRKFGTWVLGLAKSKSVWPHGQ